MRCLYCGKELALLKRWTGGEFCSDAHRQRYQEEYNQLALNRLLQATVPSPSSPAPTLGSNHDEKHPTALAPTKLQDSTTKNSETPVQARAEQGVPAAAESPTLPRQGSGTQGVTVAEAEQEPLEELELTAPAGPASLLVEPPVPAIAQLLEISIPETELYQIVLPVRSVCETALSAAAAVDLGAAGRVAIERSSPVPAPIAQPWAKSLEARDFVRAAPTIGFAIQPTGEKGLDGFEETMEILIFPRPPQGSAQLWREPERAFHAIDPQLGALVRLAFHTTGIRDEESDGGVEFPATEMHASLPTPEVAVAVGAPGPDESIEAPIAQVPVTAEAEPAHETTPAPPAEEPAAQADRPPACVATSLPMTLHGLPPGRGKPLTIFPGPTSSGIQIQVPRGAALPLRPLMIFGASPSKAAPAPKVEAKIDVKVAPAPSEKKMPERTVVVKGNKKAWIRPDREAGDEQKDRQTAKAEAKVASPEPSTPKTKQLKPVEPKPSGPKGSEPKGSEPAALQPGVKETERRDASVQAQPEAPKEEPPKAKQPEAPVSDDLGLPVLHLEPPQGFFGRLPVAAKIGVAAAVVIVAGGLIALLMKGGGGAPVSTGPRIVEAGPALASANIGWRDWEGDEGVRRTHQISILEASVPLSDYRVKFEAQIDKGAVGWVYRAMNPKNYYVEKLEIVKPGLTPTVAVVRFAVIDGEEQARSQFPLPLAVHLDTMYSVQLDAVGNHFTTWVQEQKVDEWTDDRLKAGGFGLYSEHEERASLKNGVQLVPLMIQR